MEAKTSGGGAWKSRRAQAREEKEGGAAEAKGGSAETEAKQSDSLLLQVAKYFKDQAFGAESGEGLEVVYEEFITQHAETFEGADEADDDGSGHKMEFTELHQEYLAKFEKTCEWVISVNGGTPDKFYEECQEAVQGNMPAALRDDESYSWFVDALMAALEYKCFYRLMVQAANKRAKQNRK